MRLETLAQQPIQADPRALDILQGSFGYRAFRPLQTAIINHLIRGGDALVLMPTGGGKSLCYQIPSLIRDGVGVVISPLIALMQDQVAALRQNGIRAAYLNSSLNLSEVREIEAALQQGDLDLLYIAPERLFNGRSVDLLRRIPLALFAIDEAHCVSQWGHDFRPEYIQLSQLAIDFPQVPRIALTATADRRTREEIIERLHLAGAAQFITGFDRPNIRYQIVEANAPRQQLLTFIRRHHSGKSGIVYCLSRRMVEEVAAWLADQGLYALPYHAGLSSQMRRDHQERFLREEGVIIVATIAFGMGIDKPDVRFVAHLSLPKSIEGYYQETGRAGRDGQPADAWMAYNIGDVITLRKMIESSEADEAHKRIEQNKLEAMVGLCELATCRRQALLEYFGDRQPTACGNCDNCLHPPALWDASEAARMALSTVYRSGERFGVNHLIDILLGAKGERILQHGHDRLSTWGIGKALKRDEWRSLFRQILVLGYVELIPDGYGGLCLTEACRPLLRGEQPLFLRRRNSEEHDDRRASDWEDRLESSEDRQLWQELRTQRQRWAQGEGVAAYAIFNDATLYELVTLRPHQRRALGQINGISQRKLERYGSDLLKILRRYPTTAAAETIRPTLTSTVSESLRLFRQHGDITEVAQQRQLSLSTILGHLSAAITAGDLQLHEVVQLSDDDLNQILHTIESLGSGELKQIYHALGGRYDYGTLRCVIAAQG
jgi:ATP-dependent DNA helicase RecQ